MTLQTCMEPECGGSLHRIEHAQFLYDAEGVPLLITGITLWRCERCGSESPDLPRLPALLETVAQAVVTRPGSLTGPEVRFLRKQMQLSSSELAERLGVAREWISKVENGKEALGRSLDTLLRIRYLLHIRDVSERRVEQAMEAPRQPAPVLVPYRVPLEVLAMAAH